MKTCSWLFGRTGRPFTLLAFVIFVLAIWDHGTGFFLSTGTIFTVGQLFATLALPALGLGLTLLIREFDLSIGGVLSLAGTLAILTGGQHPWVGALIGIGTGFVLGGLQAFLMVWLRLSGVAVTLGGLLCFNGLTYVLTGNESISYPNLDLALLLNAPILGVASLRSIIIVVLFFIISIVVSYTRFGRDIIATGSDRRASAIAGVNTERITVLVFVASGGLSAIAGVLLSYGLGAASPQGLADVLASAAAAGIIGGVSLVGGFGGPLGIAAGVLILSVLNAGISAIGLPSDVHDILTGAILLIVAIVDAPDFMNRLTVVRLDLAERRSSKGGLLP